MSPEWSAFDRFAMQQALQQAYLAEQANEVPVGAVVAQGDQLIAASHNQPLATHDPSAHAEVSAIRQACKTVNNYRLTNATLYVTVEPCTMCLGCLVHSRITRLVFGCREPRAGAVVSALQLLSVPGVYNHRIDWQEGLLSEEASALMTRFFAARRKKK